MTIWQFYCEFQNAPDDLAAYASSLDQQLRELNCDYDYARKFLITAAQVESVPANTFFNTIKSQQRLNGHFKVLKLSEDKKYAKILANNR